MRPVSRFVALPMVRWALGLTALGLAALLVARVALKERGAGPERCPPGLAAAGPRCCGAGQSWQAGACTGKAESCSSLQALDAQARCVAPLGVVDFKGGTLAIGGADWEGASGSERFPRSQVARFRLDAFEVTLERWSGCARQGACAPRAGEPGLPVTNVSAREAEAFCQHARGRLPSAAEWVLAAASEQARRYPWGQSGLVCRRAAFGLVAGPCAEQGGPELAGSRPDGTTNELVSDLAGNVAEWTRELDGSYTARGGSYRSQSAAQLKSWAAELGPEKARHIGFRCAYGG